MRAAPPAVALLVVLSVLAGAVPALPAAGSSASSGVPSQSAPSGEITSDPIISDPVPAQALPPGQPQVESPNASAGETINVLSIPPRDATRSTLDREYVELGSGLSFASARTEMRLSTETVTERIESAESDDARQQYLLQEVSAIEQRLITLRSRQQQVVNAYGRGELSPRRLLYELAVIDAEARELEDRRERVQTLTEATPGFSISASRFGNLELELNTLTGPVRGHAASVLSGEADTSRFFVQTGPESVVLGVIRDGTYVREVYRGPLRGGDNQVLSLGEAVNVTERAYPEVAANRLRDDTLGNPGSDSARVTIEHSRGRLVAFVDTGSERVFKEFQYRPIDQVDANATATATRDGLELTAHRTFPGGPMRLQLNSSTTGEPVDAQITVGPEGGRSSVVGRTGDDGSLWTLAPAGSYQVTAIDGSSVVILSVDATSTPMVYGAIDNSSDGGTGTATMTTPSG